MIFVSTTSLENHSDAVETVKRLVDAGITSIELGADHKFPVDAAKIIKMKKEFGLRYTVHAVFPPAKNKLMLNIGSADHETLRESIRIIKNSIDFCNKAEAELYSIHCGFLADIDRYGNPISETITKEKCLDIMKSSMAEIAEYAERYGIKIAMENHTALTAATLFIRPTEILNMIKETGLRNFGLLVDIGHLNITSNKLGFDKIEEIERVKDHILEFHISENNGERDEHKPLTSTRMIDFLPKELLKGRIVTLEGYNNFSIDDVKKSTDIIEKLIADM